MLVALAATTIGTVGGVLIGAAAGYLGGWIDELSMRTMDIVLAFPQIVLAIAVAARDYPMILGGVLFVAVLVVLVNLAVDLLYGVLDPRVRYE